MAEKREAPEAPVLADDRAETHPVEPAEGAPAPGEDPDAGRPPHPDEPAEGER